MIENYVVTATAVTAFMTVIVPVITVIVLSIKKKLSPMPFFCGVGSFFISQVILRIPILQMLSRYEAYQSFVSTKIGLVIIGGLTAGLFEETARLAFAKFILKDKLSYKNTVSFGLGHGFCEMIILVGLNSVIYLIMMLLLNSGSLETALSTSYSAENVSQITDLLTSFTAGSLYLSIIERCSAVMYHVFATTLIFEGINRKKTVQYYLLAILAHTLLNSIAVLIPNVYVVEIVLLALTVTATVFTVKQKKYFSNFQEE